ncbi:MAG: hypothetical protein ACJ8AW_29205 [Rhodopila sp.]
MPRMTERKGGQNDGLPFGMRKGQANLSIFPTEAAKLIGQLNEEWRREIAKTEQAALPQKKTYKLDTGLDLPRGKADPSMKIDIPGIIDPFRTRPRPTECPPELQQTLETVSQSVVEDKLALKDALARNKPTILEHLGTRLDYAHFCAIVSAHPEDLDRPDIDFNRGGARDYVLGLVDASPHENQDNARTEVRKHFPDIDPEKIITDPISDLVTDLTLLYLVREGMKESPTGSEEKEYWQGMELGVKNWIGKKVKPTVATS